MPEDPADPLQTNWTKDGKAGTLTGYVNPIANNTGRDPSTAWRTPAGEWRITSYGSQIYGSMDFKKWYHIGKQQGFPMGECPSFFPLPKSTPGAAVAGDNTSAPTHVIKSSHGGHDWMAVGSYLLCIVYIRYIHRYLHTNSTYTYRIYTIRSRYAPGPPRQLGTFTHEDEVPPPYKNTFIYECMSSMQNMHVNMHV
eukprot:COSAG03_NODE_409_length_8150_cov_60.438703_5_plen_196_part_00